MQRRGGIEVNSPWEGWRGGGQHLMRRREVLADLPHKDTCEPLVGREARLAPHRAPPVEAPPHPHVRLPAPDIPRPAPRASSPCLSYGCEGPRALGVDRS